MTEPSFLAQLSTTIVETAAAVAPAIVEIASHRNLASGFVWREGLIITADEALADEGKILIEFADGTRHPASVVGRDPSTDIALLRIESTGTPPPVPAGPSQEALRAGAPPPAAPAVPSHEALRAGAPPAAPAVLSQEPLRTGAPPPTPVILSHETPRPGALVVVAAAAESAPLVSFGSTIAVGPAWRSMRGGMIDARIELDMRLRPRAEGGLAISADGRILGMVVRGPRGRTLVIPSATIERIATLLLQHGQLPRGYLGLGLHQVAVTGGGPGAMVMSVDPDGPAAIAGILQGDIILRWNGENVPSVNTLLRTLDHQSIGQSVSLTIRRAGADIEAAVKIATRPHG